MLCHLTRKLIGGPESRSGKGVVPEEGLEPSRGRPRLILSQVRLPFRHSGPINKA